MPAENCQASGHSADRTLLQANPRDAPAMLAGQQQSRFIKRERLYGPRLVGYKQGNLQGKSRFRLPFGPEQRISAVNSAACGQIPCSVRTGNFSRITGNRGGAEQGKDSLVELNALKAKFVSHGQRFSFQSAKAPRETARSETTESHLVVMHPMGKRHRPVCAGLTAKSKDGGSSRDIA
jgi:hypothetical protein